VFIYVIGPLTYDFYFFYHCLIGPHWCFGFLDILIPVIQLTVACLGIALKALILTQ
jgi:hypothetical protein